VNRGTVIPAFLDGGDWSACFGLSWSALMLRDQLVSRRIVREGGSYLRKVCGTGGIAAGRNEAVASFLDDTDAEWLWMVDTDMGFSADAVDRLVDAADEHQRPVVGGLCFALQADEEPAEHYGRKNLIIPTLYEWAEQNGEQGFSPALGYEPDSLTRVTATGAAFLLIHRRVLRKMRDKHGDAWFEPVRHPTAGPGGTPRTFSEDLSFCFRLAGMSEPLFVHTGITTTHHKGGLYLDEDAFARQQAVAVLLQTALNPESEEVLSGTP
jgi:hypothetical protein